MARACLWQAVLVAVAGSTAFYRLEPEVPGGFGERTELDTSSHPSVVHRLHFEFMGWDGDDLVTTFPCYLVSGRLGRALVDTGLRSFELADVEITIDEQFQEFFPEVVDSLPTWRWLRPSGAPGASDIWTDESGDLHVSRAALDVLQRFTLTHCDIDEV